MYSKQFPPLARYTGTALSHALPTAVVGGTAPVIAQALLNATGTNAAISIYVLVMAALGIVCSYLLTARQFGPASRPRADGEAVRGSVPDLAG